MLVLYSALAVLIAVIRVFSIHQYGSQYLMRIMHSDPHLPSVFQTFWPIILPFAYLTVLAANIFSDPVFFRASVNEHSSLTQRDCHYFMTRMTSAGVY